MPHPADSFPAHLDAFTEARRCAAVLSLPPDEPAYQTLQHDMHHLARCLCTALGEQEDLFFQLEEAAGELSRLEQLRCYRQGFSDCLALLGWAGRQV